MTGTFMKMRRMRSRLLSPWRWSSARASALGLGRRVPGADQAAPDFGGRARDGFRVQRVAAEKVDLLQLREQSGTGVAAGGALHLGDRQGFARAQPIRVELGPVVEMAGDDEQVAANALPAGRGEPIGAAALHQLHELVLVFRQALPKDLLFVRRIDGDGADRALAGVSLGAHKPAASERDQQKIAGGPGKGSQDALLSPRYLRPGLGQLVRH